MAEEDPEKYSDNLPGEEKPEEENAGALDPYDPEEPEPSNAANGTGDTEISTGATDGTGNTEISTDGPEEGPSPENDDAYAVEAGGGKMPDSNAASVADPDVYSKSEPASSEPSAVAKEVDKEPEEQPPEKRQSYLRFRQKALAKLHHAKKVWAPPKVDKKKEAEMELENRRKYRGPVDHTNVWAACEAGDAKSVDRMVRDDHLDVRKQRHLAEGQTMLHLACWHGHLDLAKLLVGMVREHWGEEAARVYVNREDTTYAGSTPLLEVARSLQGYNDERLEIFKFLVQQGARLAHQDRHGDNALHWAVRRSNLGLVRHILREQEDAVLAAHADNYKLRKPIDVAVMIAEERQSYMSLEIFGLLLEMLRGSNMRMKIQSRKRARVAEDARRKKGLAEQITRAIEGASEARDAARTQWLNQNRAAENQRMKEEKEFVAAAAERSVTEAHSWLEGPYGKLEHKNLVKEIKQDMKQKVKDGTMKMPKDVSKEAKQIATDKLVKKKESEARTSAVSDFRSKNQLIKDHLKKLKLPGY